MQGIGDVDPDAAVHVLAGGRDPGAGLGSPELRDPSRAVGGAALRCCTAWKLPMGRPNCSRPVVYSAAIRKARSDTPSWIAHRPTSARVYSELTGSRGPWSRSAAETVAPSR